MFSLEMDATRYLISLLILITLPGKAQQLPDSLRLTLPDTILSVEKTLFLLEDSSDIYFSFNPDIFSGELELDWEHREYLLEEILDRISRLEKVLYTPIGNQVVFYIEGQEPAIISGPEPAGTQARSLKIRGKIFSNREQEALAYATVWITSTWQGTIANTEGYFILSIPPGTAADTIAISCMGYRGTRIPVSDLRDSINFIYLDPSVIPIQEVVIRRTEPLNLLRMALERIPDNYSRNPVIETAFYRETVLKNDEFVAVSEAVLDVYKPGFNALAIEQVKVLKGRKNLDRNKMDTLVVKLKGGLETTIWMDIIRNRPDFLQPELFHNFEYRMSDIVTVQDKNTYALDFEQKESTPPPHFRGRIYVDLETLAFRGIEFEIDPRSIKSLTGSMVYKKPRKVKVRPLNATYMVRYKAEAGRFYLSLIKAEGRFRVRARKKLFGNEFRTISEMAVTRLETEEVKRFRPRETANTQDIFSDMLGGYDPGFWGPYNYLIPEEPLEDALIRIGRLIKSK